MIPRARASSAGKRLRHSHIWDRDHDDFYTEPPWVAGRLFETEEFDRHRPLLDPCCGLGRIPQAAKTAGYCHVEAADIADRGYAETRIQNFLERRTPAASIVANPPFDQVEAFALHAFNLRAEKIALVVPVARLNAAHHWLRELPLCRIWLLTPRPSMPPGHTILRGEKPRSGKNDFCSLVFERGHVGAAQIGWMHRDGFQKTELNSARSLSTCAADIPDGQRKEITR